jgi:excisionase family DNA binding protein
LNPKRRPTVARTPWLTLGEASRLLGVSPGTIRRWADSGQLASFVTPGGHRRFPRAVVESLIPASPSTTQGGSAFSGEAMTAAYRRAGARGALKLPPWIADLSEAERLEFRERGRALVSLLLEHLDSPNPRQAEVKLEAAEGIAREYGRRAAGLGTSLSATVQGFLFFRGPFVGELARQAASRGLGTREATTLLVRAEMAMDRLLDSVLDSFRQLS